MIDRNDKRFFDFACSCGDESMAHWEKVYEDVKEELGASDKNFVDRVVYALDGMKKGQANIEHIYTDMWSGIAVKYIQYEDLGKWDDALDTMSDEEYDEAYMEDEKSRIQNFWIECDRIYHGLARAYQLVKEFDESVK